MNLAGARSLITGGASFIGSHLAEGLLARGATVRIADDFSSGRWENLSDIRTEVEVIEGDLRDPGVADRACHGQQVAFHLAAAHGGRGYIETHPLECLGNMALDHQVLQSALKGGVEKIVFASSACVYPVSLQSRSDARGLLRESEAGFEVQGAAYADGEYGWAKLMGELQVHALWKQHGVEGVACRIFTAYGERENETHAVIALIAKALTRMDPFPIWGSGEQTRNFTYVKDTVEGLMRSAELLRGFEAINLGSPTHYTIMELLDVIFRYLDWSPEEILRELDKPVGVLSRAADVEKSQNLLDWSPRTTLQEGIPPTIEWYERSGKTSDASLEHLLIERK